MATHNDITRRGLLAGVAVTGVGFVLNGVNAEDKKPERPLKAVTRSKKTINEAAAPQGRGKFEWTILGPTEVVGQPACPEFPEYYFQVAEIESIDAEVRHVIWNKQAPAGTDAIERVIVDDEGDYAEGKTPHFVDFPNRVVIMSFCSFGEFELFATVIWRDTVTRANHLQTKSIKILSKQADDT